MEETVSSGVGFLVGLIIAILIGAIVGWLASLIVKGGGSGFWMDVLIGIGGAILANILLPAIGIAFGGYLGPIVSALIGAIILLVIFKLIRKAT
jgi:uncharacterized membrane protein YeaQ/YmgE (transglycosylase-associated protein family)